MHQRTCLVHVVRACCADDGSCAKLERRPLATPIEHRATKQLEHILYVALWSRQPAGNSYGLESLSSADICRADAKSQRLIQAPSSDSSCLPQTELPDDDGLWTLTTFCLAVILDRFSNSGRVIVLLAQLRHQAGLSGVR